MFNYKTLQSRALKNMKLNNRRIRKYAAQGSLLGCYQMLWHENIHPLKTKCHPAMEKQHNTRKTWLKKKGHCCTD